MQIVRPYQKQRTEFSPTMINYVYILVCLTEFTNVKGIIFLGLIPS